MKNILNKINLAETISYLVFGVLTTFVGLIFYYIFIGINVDYKIANALSIIIAITFAYVTNKLFVFKSRCKNLSELIHEMVKFVIARSFTAFVDMAGLILCVEILGFSEKYSKLILQFIIIALNYILSKKGVFK